MVHPSHKQIEQTLTDLYDEKGLGVANVNCNEVKQVLSSLISVFDVFLVFYMTYFPEVKKALLQDKAVVEFIKKYELYLVSKILRVPSSKLKTTRARKSLHGKEPHS